MTKMTTAQQIEQALPSLDTMRESVIADDEAEGFPTEVALLVGDVRIMEQIIPESQNGALGSIKDLLDISRVLSRRNLTSAIAIGQTFLGSLPVWIAGNDAQKQRLAEILRGGGFNCLALTEEAWGSDLQSNDVSITATEEGGYTLSGKKWCINNATKGSAMSLLVRSHPAGGEQGFTMIFVDKAALDGGYDNIPRIKTHGIRGADISGIIYDQCRLSEQAVVGRLGTGLSVTLRTMQISRTLCAGFSLGAGDTCLRLATQFAQARTLYGAPILAMGTVAAKLVESYRQLLLCEAIAWTMARACTLAPEQMSVYSAVIKYLVPVKIDGLIAQCGVVLGARGYLREGEYALFQKMKRDHAVVALFDGSTEINLYVICGQLRHLFGRSSGASAGWEQFAALYDLQQSATHFEGEGLKLSNRGKDVVWEGLEALATQACEWNDAVLALLSAREQLKDRFTALEGKVEQTSEAMFAIAKEYCELTGQAIYLQFSHVNREPLLNAGALWGAPLLGKEALAENDQKRLLEALLKQTRENALYSHSPFALS